jgi:predicted nucleotidyltransferase component of viral defense system
LTVVIPSSFTRSRYSFIAKEEDRTFQDVWKTLILERFLVRIAQSKFADQFVFKGGLLLARYIHIGRETKDIDFLARAIKAERETIQAAFESICALSLTDGFAFFFSDIATLEHHHMNYPGFRLRLQAQFGGMKDRIQVDIGVGDVVQPKTESLELYQYKGRPIFEGRVTLQIYPIETIFAEKLETIASKGAANSRMKDFHDLIMICREANLINVSKLKGDISKTFENRGTLKSLPIQFSAEDIAAMQKLWSAHCRGLGQLTSTMGLPEDFGDVVNQLNDWLELNQIG